MPAFAFDPTKSASNHVKHGVDLAFGERIFADAGRIVMSSFREIDGEYRYKAVGLVDGRLYTAVHVKRDDVIRFISVRRSNDGEERAYRAEG